jgi:hypothetical protein
MEQYIARTKDVLSVIRDLGIAFLLILFLTWPSEINALFVDAGFTRGDIGPFHWEKPIAQAAEQTAEAGQTVDTLRQSIDDAVLQIQKLSAAIPNPDIKQSLGQVEAQLHSSLSTAQSASSAIKTSAQLQNSVLPTQRGTEQNDAGGTWAVVISADKKPDLAAYEVRRANKSLGYQQVAIYQRKNFLRTAITFHNRAEAEAELPKIQAHIRESSYVVNMDSWCPAPVKSDAGDIYLCGGE